MLQRFLCEIKLHDSLDQEIKGMLGKINRTNGVFGYFAFGAFCDQFLARQAADVTCPF